MTQTAYQVEQSQPNFPSSLDTDDNLYLVHDYLRVKLAYDYNPGDTSIVIYDEYNVFANFPPTGIITLTEQCSDIGTINYSTSDLRAISFYYSTKTATGFANLFKLNNFTDCIKPANITNVTLNVTKYHHETIKNTVIAIQEYVGLATDINTSPQPAQDSTLSGRINYLKKLVYTPKAWFTANLIKGVVDIHSQILTVTFTDQSQGLGPGDITYQWSINGSIVASFTNTQTYTHEFPIGIYDISLEVSNEYGSDSVTFVKMITARTSAPEEADLEWQQGIGQTVTNFPSVYAHFTAPDGSPAPNESNYYIRAPIDTFVNVFIGGTEGPSAINLNDSILCDMAGELLVSHELGYEIIDPITTYTWSLGDDLTHASQPHTQGLYSQGGMYDLILRVDTTLGAYRITQHHNAIDMVEPQNLWLWMYSSASGSGYFNKSTDTYEPLSYLNPSCYDSSGPTVCPTVNAFEFGLISETFKAAMTPLTVTNRSEGFINSTTQNGETNVPQAQVEFRRNVSFTSCCGGLNSGDGGQSVLYWAGQGAIQVGSGATYADHEVITTQYKGFFNTYVSGPSVPRPWNWVCLTSDTTSYFLLGVDYTCGTNPGTSPTYQVASALDLTTFTLSSMTMNFESYMNGAAELRANPVNYDNNNNIITGNYSVYRSAWKGSSGYILRNSAVGAFFRIKSFYQTQGTLGQEFQSITKLTDMIGPAKIEGQLVALSDGLFFFNNSGNIVAYNDTTGTWESGGASATSAPFRNLQDTRNVDFDNAANTLLATSYDRTAFLSYDYSSAALMKFNSLDLAFYALPNRPVVSAQFLMGVY